MILASAHILNKEFGKANQFQAIQGWDENQQVPDDSYLKVGLSKYFVSKGVFTMRASHSLSMTDSMLLKAYLDVSREYVLGTWSPKLVEVSPPLVESPEPRRVHQVIRPVTIPSGPTIYVMPAGYGLSELST